MCYVLYFVLYGVYRIVSVPCGVVGTVFCIVSYFVLNCFITFYVFHLVLYFMYCLVFIVLHMLYFCIVMYCETYFMYCMACVVLCFVLDCSIVHYFAQAYMQSVLYSIVYSLVLASLGGMNPTTRVLGWRARGSIVCIV